MAFKLVFTQEAKANLNALASDTTKLKRVNRCLALLEKNPRHPGLHSHKYSVMKTEDNQDVWESYVENNSPAAWRVFWYYGPSSNHVTVIAITQHP